MAPFTLKNETRVVGIDDGPYVRGSERTLIVMTIYRLDGYIDGFLSGWIDTDGSDASETIGRSLNNSRFKDQIRCIISDGGCLAGFNVLDLSALCELTSLPVITASDEPPDTDSVMRALSSFRDGEGRLKLLTAHTPYPITLPEGKCWIRFEGIDGPDAERVVRRATIRGRTPEPVRISHMVARSLSDSMDRRYNR